jgi:hypothetical protein
LEKGLTVSALNDYAGGEGFANECTRWYDGRFTVDSIVWADENGCYIESSLSGSGELPELKLFFASFRLNQ